MNRTTAAERRLAPRIDVLEYVVVRAGDHEETAVLQNVGLGGILFQSRLGFEVDDHLEIVVGTEDSPVALACEVRHCRANYDGTMHATGVRFTPRNPDERRAVAEFLHGVVARNYLDG
ncbi:MAG: PilZ domain-containing protein [Fimbriimonadaceae bacterium]|nr:PilZ domain-containing protein [Fimbriimonadaceae bacterium]